MEEKNKQRRRDYHAPMREAAATRTREAIVRAATQLFEERGWAATTVRSIADTAGVSPKTVEADFGTKAALLEAAVAYAIRGDLDPRPVAQRGAITQVEQAPDAATMLRLHAAHLLFGPRPLGTDRLRRRTSRRDRPDRRRALATDEPQPSRRHQAGNRIAPPKTWAASEGSDAEMSKRRSGSPSTGERTAPSPNKPTSRRPNTKAGSATTTKRRSSSLDRSFLRYGDSRAIQMRL